MKVRELTKLIEDLQLGPEDEIAVMIFDKSCFDWNEDDDMELTDEGWAKVVAEFESASVLFENVSQEINFAVIDHSRERIA